MALVEGGSFWVGSPRGQYSPEETPRFETKLASFCIERTEATVAAYRECVAAGVCKAARKTRRFCNERWPGRENHPINCVNWYEARNYCGFRSARLPSEVEWEYAARGGGAGLRYPWGDEPPDGRTCWKHVGGSCAVKSFAAGAFGLYDVVGNVWEWTDDWFADYPWPASFGLTKVYRGGGWSRRFEKWMRPQLRNRGLPTEWGSHLGFRCARTPEGVECPFGRSATSGRCLHGVLNIDCPKHTAWNGQRCAPRGAAGCAAGTRDTPGFGCVPLSGPVVTAPSTARTDAADVVRAPTPEFDADCLRYHPTQPHAYRYTGGTHDDRNAKSRRAGCRNRDVGAGWNSTCCP